MKERIYSIPLTDALNEGCGCILCTIEKKLEQDGVTYFLGPSLMEPNNREMTNDKGFCRRHLNMLLEGNHRLGLALILETHVKALSQKLDVKKKTGLFSKGIDTDTMSSDLYNCVHSCALCDKLSAQMADAAGNLAYLWDKENDFRSKFEKAAALCPEHMALVISVCKKELNSKKSEEFTQMLINQQKNALDALYDDLHSFTLSFDYRNTGKPDKNVADSVPRTVKHLTKF